MRNWKNRKSCKKIKPGGRKNPLPGFLLYRKVLHIDLQLKYVSKSLLYSASTSDSRSA
jgi:hypothetical protein